MAWTSVIGGRHTFSVDAQTNLEDYNDWERITGSGTRMYIRDDDPDPVRGWSSSGQEWYRNADTSVTSADHEIIANCRSGRTLIGVVVRADAGGAVWDGYAAEISGYGDGDLHILRYVAGSGTIIATQTASYGNQTQDLRLRATGTGATVYLTAQWGANSELTYEDTHADRIVAQGYPGLTTHLGGSPTAEFWNFDILQDVAAGVATLLGPSHLELTQDPLVR